jgi:hypothetical protein
MAGEAPAEGALPNAGLVAGVPGAPWTAGPEPGIALPGAASATVKVVPDDFSTSTAEREVTLLSV